MDDYLEVFEKPWNREQTHAFYQIVNPMPIFVPFGHHSFNKFNSNHRQELLKCLGIGGLAGKTKEDGFIKGSVKTETHGQRQELKCELCILKTCEQVTCGPSPDQSCSSSRVHQIKFRSFPHHPASSQCFILLEPGNTYWGTCTVPVLRKYLPSLELKWNVLWTVLKEILIVETSKPSLITWIRGHAYAE